MRPISLESRLTADRQSYEVAENDARAAKRGLWADNEPVLERPVALPITPDDEKLQRL
jgi:endonuclease YncB( thermonuclease family)